MNGWLDGLKRQLGLNEYKRAPRRSGRQLRLEVLEGRLAPAAGVLDTSFGTGGKVITDFAAKDEQVYSIAVQADGKVVVAGYTGNSGNTDFALARYNADGTLDSTFGSGGKVTTDFASADDGAHSMAVQADGKIVLAGSATISGTLDFALARYNTDGTLDSTFGSGGKVTTDFASALEDVSSVAVQSDGKLVVAGYTTNGSNTNFALARYNADGTLDSTFGSGGKVTTDFGANDGAKSVAVQSDGKLVVAGDIINGVNDDFALARYNADGTLDSTFGSGGKVTTDFASADRVTSMAVQADGKLVVTGSTKNATSDFALARYNTNGTLDSTFGTGGKVTTDFASADDVANSVAVQADGKLVVAGYASNGSNFDIALARYDATGTLDPTFGTGGKVTTDFNSTDDGANSMAVQADGKIVVAGTSYTGANNDFALARYLGDLMVGTHASTMSAVSSSANASTVGQAITLSVRVGDAMNVATSGTVSFYDGVVLLGHGTFDSSTGRWNLMIATLPSGTHSITTTYTGNAYYAVSPLLASAFTQVVNAVGTHASTTGVVSSSVSPSALGQTVILSVRVGDAVNVATYGTVAFFDGMTFLGNGTFNKMTSRWELMISTLATGSHSITANFMGNAYYAVSASPSAFSQTVGVVGTHPDTTSAVASSANASVVSQAVTFSVRVGDAANVATYGTVSFFDGMTFLGYGTFDMMTGRWKFTTTTLASGSHTITATYTGNAYYAASVSLSPPLIQVVQ